MSFQFILAFIILFLFFCLTFIPYFMSLLLSLSHFTDVLIMNLMVSLLSLCATQKCMPVDINSLQSFLFITYHAFIILSGNLREYSLSIKFVGLCWSRWDGNWSYSSRCDSLALRLMGSGLSPRPLTNNFNIVRTSSQKKCILIEILSVPEPRTEGLSKSFCWRRRRNAPWIWLIASWNNASLISFVNFPHEREILRARFSIFVCSFLFCIQNYWCHSFICHCTILLLFSYNKKDIHKFIVFLP